MDQRAARSEGLASSSGSNKTCAPQSMASAHGWRKASPACSKNAQVTRVFLDFPEIFRCGPILEMANMAALQYAVGVTNRGVLHDGMHMAYAPYIDIIVSTDAAFLELGAKHDFCRLQVRPLPPSFFGQDQLRPVPPIQFAAT